MLHFYDDIGIFYFFCAKFKASIVFHSFVLKVSLTKAYTRRPWKETAKCHSSLKVVEVVWFSRCTRDVEIADYSLGNAMSLEKTVLDSRSLVLYACQENIIENHEAARECGRQFGLKLTPEAQLIVLK